MFCPNVISMSWEKLNLLPPWGCSTWAATKQWVSLWHKCQDDQTGNKSGRQWKPGQNSLQRDAVQMSDAYRPTQTEGEKTCLRQKPPYSLLLLHSSLTREHSCSTASWGMGKGRQSSRHTDLLPDRQQCRCCSVSTLGVDWITVIM